MNFVAVHIAKQKKAVATDPEVEVPSKNINLTKAEVLKRLTKMMHHAFKMAYEPDSSNKPAAYFGDQPVKPTNGKIDIEQLLVDCRDAFARNI